MQSTFHHFPLVIFVLFVANLFLLDLYQSAIVLPIFSSFFYFVWFVSFVVLSIWLRPKAAPGFICVSSVAIVFLSKIVPFLFYSCAQRNGWLASRKPARYGREPNGRRIRLRFDDETDLDARGQAHHVLVELAIRADRVR